MFDVSEGNLRVEIESAIKLNRRHTDMGWKLVRQYAGRDYRSDWTLPEDNYLGHEASFAFNTVPNLVYTNPKVDVKGLLAMVDDQVGVAIQQGLNQWIPASRFNETLIECAYWIQFMFAVTYTALDVLPGYEGAPEPFPLAPRIWVVNPLRFFQDPQGGRNAWRYRGHVWVQDKDDLLAAVGPDGQPLFDAAAVNALTAEAGLVEAAVNKDSPELNQIPRNRIVGYEVFVRESGMIYTLGFSGNSGGAFLRQPRPWDGHKDGPYTVYGVYLVPDQVYPLPPLAVTAAKVRELNAHRGQVSDDAGAAKNLILYDLSQPKTGEKIARANNNSVIGVPNLMAGAVKEVKIAGPNPANLDYIDRLMYELNETSGQTDQRRGNVTGGTATEIEEVAQADDVRTEFLRSRFRACVIDNLNIVVDFMIHNPQVAFLIEIDTPQGKMPFVYRGGLFDANTGEPQDPAVAHRVRLEIQARSMEYVDSGMMQRRAIQNVEVIGNLAPAMAANPQVNWKALLDDLGESQNVSNMGEKYLDVQVLGAMQQQAAMAQAQTMELEAQAATQPGGEPKGKGKGGRASGSKKKGEPQGAGA